MIEDFVDTYKGNKGLQIGEQMITTKKVMEDHVKFENDYFKD